MYTFDTSNKRNNHLVVKENCKFFERFIREYKLNGNQEIHDSYIFKKKPL